MPKDTEIIEKNGQRTLPAPVKVALNVLSGLEQERAEKLRKPLPAYAMTLARQGREVTEQVLHDALTKGDTTVMGPRPAFTKAAETVEQRYERITGKWPRQAAEDNPRLSINDRLIKASEHGDLKLIEHLVRQGADIRAYNDDALRRAAENGHLDVVTYLVEKGADVRAYNDDALRRAAENGHLDVVTYLVEKGADIRAYNDDSLRWAASNGHLDVVTYLAEKGADIRAYNDDSLHWAAYNGHLNVVTYLAENGADVRANNDCALLWAANKGHLDIIKYLINEGADLSILPSAQQKEFKPILKNMDIWMKETRTYPPKGLEDKPLGSFDPATVNTLGSLIKKEDYNGLNANRYAYKAVRLFGTAERVMDYFEKWAKPGHQPLHDIVQMIDPPYNAPNIPSWASAVIEHGPEMAKLVKFADKLPQPCRSADSKGWSLTKTRNETAKFAYPRAGENHELAILFNRHSKNEDDFNIALGIVNSYKGKTKGRIPDITINGEKFGLPKAAFKKLPDGDYRGLVLGELTACCQSIGGTGAECARHGFTSENGGFYIVAVNDNKKGEEIIGQSWAWRGTKGELVLDSLETLGDRIKPEQWTKLAKEFSKALEKTDVTALHLGKGGNTPDNMPFETARVPAKPVDYNGYRDSDRQYKL